MGKYQGYDKYKDSGVEWLGDIPEHWECMTLKRHLLPKVGAIKTGPFGSQLLSSEMNDTEVKVYNQRNVLDQDFVGGTNYISEIKYQELKSFEVFPGDFLITTRGTIGKCAITPADCPKGILHPCLMRLQLNPKSLLDHFLMYLLQDGEVILEQLKIKSNATTIDVIYSDSLKSVFIPTPPLEEQKKIARFLDYKTKQIDELIAKKETLIEKLDEKRTSLISHAVTKGLDVNVSMKDSGIEWLGDIPKHWQQKRFKFAVYLINNKIEAEDSNLPYMGLEHIESWTGKRIEDENASSEGIGSHFLPDDVLFGKLRPYLAKVYLSEIEGLASTEALVLRSKKYINPKYLKYYILSREFINIVNSSTFGAKMPRASWDFIGNLFLLIPPLHEQQKIAEYLDQKTAEIEEQKTKIQQAIDLLKEYRTALITNAVTGKIDVRKITIPKI